MNRSDDPSERVESLVVGAHLGAVARLLAARRDAILDHWLVLATQLPFHHGHREHAIADHIPRLFDALVAYLERATARWVDPGAPLDDPAILAAARDHARIRFEQGLRPVDVVTEFRLLRQEIGFTLRQSLADGLLLGDVLGAQLLVHDAIDGAVSLALAGLGEHVDAVREDFLATTVHEVSQPITVLSGSLQLARRALTRPEPRIDHALDALNRAEAATRRMQALLDHLTNASRLAMGSLALKVTPVDLRDILAAAVDQLDPATVQRVRMAIPSTANTRGQWDAGALREVIDNLLSNAVKYSPEDTPIEVTVQDGGEWVSFSVQDRGIGLSTEDQTQLFQRYGRGSGAITHGVTGLGLGLYLCRGIVDAHGGQIRAESPGPGQGTTIHVQLPRVPPPAMI